MVVGDLTQETEVLVVGGGPGGYAAAFRAADLGLEVTLVEIAGQLGGACLLRGCIPSKTYLHLSELITDARRAEAMGVRFGAPEIDLNAIRSWKSGVVEKLSSGLMQLARQRGVQVIGGRAVFDGPDSVRLHNAEISRMKFKNAVIATGAHPTPFPGMEGGSESRVMNSTTALDLPDIPKALLVVGGGYVGLELGSAYAALGSEVTVVEMSDRLLAGADKDLVRVLEKRLGEIFRAVHLNTRVVEMSASDHGVRVTLSTGNEEVSESFDRVLVAMGRKPNTSGLGLDKAGVEVDDSGFIISDDQQRTTNSKIFAVGDAAGGVMLAHKAAREGKIAAEVIAGHPAAFDVRAMPAVVYTDPQVAWAGVTEADAKTLGRDMEVRRFPWKISGRAATMGVDEGITKLIVETDSRRVVGMGIVGRHAEALIAEGVLAIEMGALVDDLALSVHPHPTLSETEAEVAEIFLGSATHILSPKKK